LFKPTTGTGGRFGLARPVDFYLRLIIAPFLGEKHGKREGVEPSDAPREDFALLADGVSPATFRLRAQMRLILAVSYLAVSCIVLGACAGSSETAAPVETIAPAEPDANPLGDDPDVIPFDGSAAYLRGFA
jgi:hypothetical protein